MGLVYNKSGDFIEITIRDNTMRKVGSWKFNTSDIELASGILNHLQRKYGFSPEINHLKKEEQEQKDNKKGPFNFMDLDVKW